MPESKPRKKTARAAEPVSATQAYKPNPVWFKPVMFGLMIIGLLWIITFYISEGQLPVQATGSHGTSWPDSALRSSASS